MYELIALVVTVALSGAICLPIVVLVLARFGYFEPVEFSAFGRNWSFARPINVASTRSVSETGFFSYPAATATTPIVLMVAAHLNVAVSRDIRVSFGSPDEGATYSNATTREYDLASVGLQNNA
jgi:hypothetical protein